MTSKGNSKRSRGNQSRPDPRHLGIEFKGPQHRAKFETIHERELCVQKFPSVATLNNLYISNYIRSLFENIGWQGLLDLRALGYKRPTLEFLSSVYLDHEVLHFRMMNRDCEITETQICDIIGAPTQNTFGPNDNPPGYSSAQFWFDITGLQSYNPTSTKASSIIHPLLKIAHRILASILYPRKETSTINSHELKLLYCLTHPHELKPHFGRWLCHKLILISNTTKGAFACGGTITVLARSPHVRALPDPVGDLVVIPGTTRLNMEAYTACKVLRHDEANDSTDWLVGPHHLVRFTTNPDSLYIFSPNLNIEETDWTLANRINEGPLLAESDDSEDEDFDPAAPSSPPTNSAVPPPYHDQYMGHFQTMGQQYDALNASYTNLHQNYTNLNTTVHNLGQRVHRQETNFDQFNQNFTTFRSDYNTHNNQRATQLNNIERLLTGIHGWAINQPGYPRPPSPPPPEDNQ